MSRIGKQPIEIPSGVEIDVDGSRVAVKGPRGSLEESPPLRPAFDGARDLDIECSAAVVVERARA